LTPLAIKPPVIPARTSPVPPTLMPALPVSLSFTRSGRR
jgi:hypothetical protein